MWATMADRSNVNIDLWNLFIAIVSLALTYQGNNDFSFNSIKKISI